MKNLFILIAFITVFFSFNSYSQQEIYDDLDIYGNLTTNGDSTTTGNSQVDGNETIVGTSSASSYSAPSSSSTSSFSGLQINNSQITATGTTNLDLNTADATAAINAKRNFSFQGKKLHNSFNDNTSGTNVELQNHTLSYVRLTAAGTLVSIGSIPIGSGGDQRVIINQTGATVEIINEYASATATNRIRTSNGVNYKLADGEAIMVSYDTPLSRWLMVSGPRRIDAKGQADSSFSQASRLEFKERSFVKTNSTDAVIYDSGIIYDGGFEAATKLDGWTCTGSADMAIESKPVDASTVIAGNRSLKISCNTVGGCFCHQDITINQQQRGRSILLSGEVRTSSYTQGLTLTYRENGADTDVKTEQVFYGTPTTQSVIGSSANSVGIKFSIPYSASPIVVRIDSLKLEYGSAITNQPALTPMKSYGPITITPSVSGTITKGPTNVDDASCGTDGSKVRCKFKYRQTATTGAVAATGLYLIDIPNGYKNKNFTSSTVLSYSGCVNPSTSQTHPSIIGTCSFNTNTAYDGARGLAIAYSDSKFYCVMIHSGSTCNVAMGSGYNATTSANNSWEADIEFEDASLSASIPTYTGRCSDKKNCSTTLAFSRNTSNVISNISPASSTYNPTCSGTTTLICDLTSGNFTVTPVCWARRLDAQEVAQYASATSTTSVTIPLINLSGSSVNIPVRVYCERQGSDFDNAFILQQNVALKEYFKIVEQFPTTETIVCENCYKTKTLYKICRTGSTTTGTTIATGVTEMTKQYGSWVFSGTLTGGIPYNNGTQTARFDFNQSTGVITAVVDATRVINGCVEYTK